MINNDEFLSNIPELLKLKKSSLINGMRLVEEELDDYKSSFEESIKHVSDETKAKMDSLVDVLNSYDELTNKAIDLHEGLRGYLDLNLVIQKFNSNFEDPNQFYDIIVNLRILDINEIQLFLTNTSKKVGIKYPGSIKDYKDYNSKVLYAKGTRKKLLTKLLANENITHTEIINAIKNDIGDNTKFFHDNIMFLEKLIDELNAKIDKISDELGEIGEKEIANKKEERDKKLKEFNEKITDINVNCNKVDEANVLYKKYIETKDNEILNTLLNLLLSLELISLHDYNKLTYKKEEKVEDIKEEPKKEIIEDKKVEIKPLDGDYFRRKETQNIFCFLGDDKNSFYNDIFNIDNSKRTSALKWLNSLFNELYLNKDSREPLGAAPISTESNRKTRLLLKTPYNFIYKRFGTGAHDYRLHAISRHSKLLEDLGYGQGNIIFFGAIDINADDNKDDTYSNVGKRTVEQLSTKKREAKLKPSFEYIEHITRGFIPVSLLSNNDKIKASTSQFHGPDSFLDGYKYINYTLLDSDSLNNVMSFLDKYFINQTNILFNIIDEYNKKRGNTLD